jgi:hypothetical protein
MFIRYSSLFSIVFVIFPALAAGPSTPWDWQKMYNACLQGIGTVSQQMNLGQGFAPTFCACVRDSLQQTPEADRDAKYQAIQDRCTQSAKQSQQSDAGAWPAAGIATLRTTCYQQPRKDVPPRSLDAYCTCYVDLTPRNVTWQDWLLIDLAIKTKGIQNLDAQERSILTKALQDATYCFQKNVPQ